jgi:hypothetical protein
VSASSSHRTFREAFEDSGGTDHVGTGKARRPADLLVCGSTFMRRRPRGERVAKRQGGQQSGAAGEVPLANTKFAGRLMNNWGENSPTNNRQAEVAMD